MIVWNILEARAMKWDYCENYDSSIRMLMCNIYRENCFIFLIFVIKAHVNGESIAYSLDQVSCESTENVSWPIGVDKICFMWKSTSITTKFTYITSSRNENVTDLMFANNKKIRFLPVETFRNFPKLVSLYAQNCSIESISRDNFKRLRKLRELYLTNNQISRIENDTFKDLTSLELLSLGEFESISGFSDKVPLTISTWRIQ